MKWLLLTWISLFSTLALAFGPNFPSGPDTNLTPGKLCDRPSGTRYPEHIAYCERDVSPDTKAYLIKMYDQKLGYRISTMNRLDFKIDHFIPLCAGGSNDIVNLWPQHRSIYEITDPVEPLLCQKMLEGKLHQSDAVMLIMKAKLDLRQVPQVIRILNSL